MRRCQANAVEARAVRRTISPLRPRRNRRGSIEAFRAEPAFCRGRTDMRHHARLGLSLALVVAAALAVAGTEALTQAVAPTNSAPNPFRTIEGFAKMPEGRIWGSTAAVGIDPDGSSIWVAERCAAQ